MDATSPITRARAKRLRANMNLPERRLWWALRKSGLDGLKFRRQHPLGPFVLDFYCHAARLAVEVDGGSHGIAGRRESDARRDEWLRDRGIHTLRLSARLLEDDPGMVLARIREAAARPKH
jgi:very-short-patch-repair endonuclease